MLSWDEFDEEKITAAVNSQAPTQEALSEITAATQPDPVTTPPISVKAAPSGEKPAAMQQAISDLATLNVESGLEIGRAHV